MTNDNIVYKSTSEFLKFVKKKQSERATAGRKVRRPNTNADRRKEETPEAAE